MKGLNITAFLLFLLLGMSLADAAAQNCKRGPHEDFLTKLITEKSRYLQDKIGLEGKTAEEFANIYRDMEIKKFKAAHDVYRKAKQLRRSEMPVSDAEYLKSAEEQAAVPVKMAEIEYQFFSEIKEILSPEELFLFYHWERRFGKEMIRKTQAR